MSANPNPSFRLFVSVSFVYGCYLLLTYAFNLSTSHNSSSVGKLRRLADSAYVERLFVYDITLSNISCLSLSVRVEFQFSLSFYCRARVIMSSPEFISWWHSTSRRIHAGCGNNVPKHTRCLLTLHVPRSVRQGYMYYPCGSKLCVDSAHHRATASARPT